MTGKRRSIITAANERSSLDGLPNAVSVITRWSRPLGTPDASDSYFWSVATWWIKFGAAAYGGSVRQFARSLPVSRLSSNRFQINLASGKSISAPIALALINPPDWEGLSAKAAHTVAYSVPELDLFDLLFGDALFVQQAILDFDAFMEWLGAHPRMPWLIPLLARYVGELVARQPSGIETSDIQTSFSDWLDTRDPSAKGAAAVSEQAARARIGQMEVQDANPGRSAPSVNDVDVYGHFSSPIGIGEDARLIARAWEMAGYRVNRIDLTEGELGKTTAPFAFWAVPAPNLALRALRFTAEHDAQFKIIATPWELASTPESLHWVYRAADATCVYADFVLNSLPADIRESTIKLPMPFDCTSITGDAANTEKEELFTVAAMFDFGSYIQRKGPLHVIAAFKAAFGANEHVRLVLKSMHRSDRPEEFASLQRLIGDDPRILLVDSIWPSEQVHRFLKAAHVFVSLHASEGFGRVLAESMLLDTLVIATNYSGSSEICTPETALLVPYELVPLADDDYLLGSGQHWARPDIAAAAAAMRLAFREWRAPPLTKIRERARDLIQSRFSLEATASSLGHLMRDAWGPACTLTQPASINHPSSTEAARAAAIEAAGYLTLRFWNNDVLTNIDGVLTEIEAALATRSARSQPLTPGAARRPRSSRRQALSLWEKYKGGAIPPG